jgi:radical SAM superfamily enzyme
VALAGFNCGPWEAATAGNGCAFCGCAASAEESCGMIRIAAAAQRKHETAAMVRTDERRKKSSENDLPRC